MIKNTLALIIVATLLSCSNSNTGFDKKEEKKSPSASLELNTPIDNSDTIWVVASGADMSQIKFDTKLIKVPTAKLLTIALQNKSTDATMPHNLVIIQPGTANDVGQAGYKFLDNGYVAPDDKNVIAHSPVAQINETVYFTFTTPAAGEYQFICSYPGHWGLMKGTFITE
jgi:azurin